MAKMAAHSPALAVPSPVMTVRARRRTIIARRQIINSTDRARTARRLSSSATVATCKDRSLARTAIATGDHMADTSLDKIRNLFADEIRGAEATLKGLATNIHAGELRAKELAELEAQTSARLDALRTEVREAEADLKKAKTDAAALRAAARGESDAMRQKAHRYAIDVTTRVNEAVRKAALDGVSAAS
jgi:chromosome segregation ATPase